MSVIEFRRPGDIRRDQSMAELAQKMMADDLRAQKFMDENADKIALAQKPAKA